MSDKGHGTVHQNRLLRIVIFPDEKCQRIFRLQEKHRIAAICKIARSNPQFMTASPFPPVLPYPIPLWKKEGRAQPDGSEVFLFILYDKKLVFKGSGCF